MVIFSKQEIHLSMNAKIKVVQKTIIKTSLVISIILAIGPAVASEPTQYIVGPITCGKTGDIVRILQ